MIDDALGAVAEVVSEGFSGASLLPSDMRKKNEEQSSESFFYFKIGVA